MIILYAGQAYQQCSIEGLERYNLDDLISMEDRLGIFLLASFVPLDKWSTPQMKLPEECHTCHAV